MSILAVAAFATLVGAQDVDAPCSGTLEQLRPYIEAALTDPGASGKGLSSAIDRVCPHGARLRALSYAIDYARSDSKVDESQAAMNLSRAIDGSDPAVSIRIAQLALSLRADRLGLCRSVFEVLDSLSYLQLEGRGLRNALLLNAAKRGDRGAAFAFARDVLDHSDGDRHMATQIMQALMDTEPVESGREEMKRILQPLGSVAKRDPTDIDWERVLASKTRCEIDPLLILEGS